ncbi:hypothetical protein BDQ17DRAFT_1409881 [Cyathus striatus]|nr:hypothetical protein BDQ17DRAFT_1409881 [Cyathus striatus]
MAQGCVDWGRMWRTYIAEQKGRHIQLQADHFLPLGDFESHITPRFKSVQVFRAFAQLLIVEVESGVGAFQELRKTVATTDYGGNEAVMCSPSSPRHLESRRKGTALRDRRQTVGMRIAFDMAVKALEGYEPKSTVGAPTALLFMMSPSCVSYKYAKIDKIYKSGALMRNTNIHPAQTREKPEPAQVEPSIPDDNSTTGPSEELVDSELGIVSCPVLNHLVPQVHK